MGPQNGVMGDDNFGTELPETQVDQEQLLEEKKLAKYSQSEEYQRLKLFLENKIQFYQTFLPDGRPVTEVSQREREGMWVAANVIISEFKQLIEAYEGAFEAVKESEGARRTRA
jgi:hypothetical protein